MKRLKYEKLGVPKMTIEKNILMKNNVLVKARYSLTLVQSKIFIVMLYKLQKDEKRGMSCSLPRKELQRLISSNDSKTILGIKELLTQLMDQRIYFKEEINGGKNSVWGQYNLINGFEYNDKTDVFTIACSERVYDLLMSYLEIGYTPVNLSVYLSLKNPNAQRMYDLLRLWSNSKKIIRYDVEELKELLMLEDKYKNYADFKRYVLNSSKKALNETGVFEIDFKENKTGRKVTSIDFHVKDLDDRVYFKNNLNEESKNTPEKPQNPSESFFIPNEDVFTKGTIILFKKDFKGYDFKKECLQDAFYDAMAALFEKDDVEKIKHNGYKYFKATLLEKIDYYIKKHHERSMWENAGNDNV